MHNRQTLLKSNVIINLLLIIAFFILSIANTVLIWHFHQIPMKSLDMSFHWQRIGELAQNHAWLPNYATNLFSGNGSAVMTMYPYLLLYPVAILYLHLKSVLICSFIMFGLSTWLSLIISYYSSLSINHSRKTSFIFALTYTITPFFTATGIGWYETGVFNSLIFIPLVIFGFMHFLNNGHWQMMSIGISLMVYSSVISTAITLIFLLIWLLFNCYRLHRHQIYNLCKAILLTVLTSAIFWLPLIKILSLNQINRPRASQIVSNQISQLISVPLTNQASLWDALTIYSILGIITGIIIFKRLTPITKQAYGAAILVTLISSHYFPWQLLDHTAANMLQYTGRLLLIPQVILTYTLAIFISHHLLQKPAQLNIEISIILMIIMGIQWTNQAGMFHQFNTIEKRLPASNRIVTQPRFQAQIHHPSAVDYYPSSALRGQPQLWWDQGVDYSQKKNVSFKVLGNGTFAFYTHHYISKLQIPFLAYHGTIYHGYLDGRHKNLTPNSQQLLIINHVKRGFHRLHIHIITSRTVSWARILTLFSLPIYAIIIIRKLI